MYFYQTFYYSFSTWFWKFTRNFIHKFFVSRISKFWLVRRHYEFKALIGQNTCTFVVCNCGLPRTGFKSLKRISRLWNSTSSVISSIKNSHGTKKITRILFGISSSTLLIQNALFINSKVLHFCVTSMSEKKLYSNCLTLSRWNSHDFRHLPL